LDCYGACNNAWDECLEGVSEDDQIEWVEDCQDRCVENWIEEDAECALQAETCLEVGGCALGLDLE
jgi:hypothetical protein